MHSRQASQLHSGALIKQTTLLAKLDWSRSKLNNYRKRDASFPKPIKEGNSRQAAVYYVLAEVEAWLNTKMASRSAANDGEWQE